MDRRAGLERVGQGDGPLIADFVPWNKRESEGKGEEEKEIRGNGVKEMRLHERWLRIEERKNERGIVKKKGADARGMRPCRPKRTPRADGGRSMS